MIEYIKSKKGYYYKLLKNGEKKRISQDEYNKKIKSKKMTGGAGEPIEEDDIIYKDDLVYILKPEVKKGILVFSQFDQPPEMDSLCTEGLKTGQQLQKEGIKFGRGVYHPHIFFCAPHYSRPIDYSTIDTEINSSFGNINKNSKVFIRVHPDRTFVFSSEIRAQRPDSINELNKSKKTLTRYLQIIKENESIKIDFEKEAYNLYTSQKKSSILKQYPLDASPIERNSEILVSTPHLIKDYFVICYPQPSPLPPSPPPLKRYFPNPIGFPPKIDSIWNPLKGQWISPKHKKWMKEGYPEWVYKYKQPLHIQYNKPISENLFASSLI
jgi:hypothetical protein